MISAEELNGIYQAKLAAFAQTRQREPERGLDTPHAGRDTLTATRGLGRGRRRVCALRRRRRPGREPERAPARSGGHRPGTEASRARQSRLH